MAVRKALGESGANPDVAVLGCGALGLTSALLLQRAGVRATIYAKEPSPEVRPRAQQGPGHRIREWRCRAPRRRWLSGQPIDH